MTKNVQSVLDRAKTVIFDPPVQEVHEYVRGWWSKENKDIFDYIGDNLKRIGRPSIRWYTDMLREKRLGNNWRGWLVSQWHEDNPLLAEVGEILNSDLIGEARIAEWKERTGMSRPSFFIYQRQWNDAQGNR